MTATKTTQRKCMLQERIYTYYQIDASVYAGSEKNCKSLKNRLKNLHSTSVVNACWPQIDFY